MIKNLSVVGLLVLVSCSQPQLNKSVRAITSADTKLSVIILDLTQHTFVSLMIRDITPSTELQS
jgi:hypothetical protein